MNPNINSTKRKKEKIQPQFVPDYDMFNLYYKEVKRFDTVNKTSIKEPEDDLEFDGWENNDGDLILFI